MERLEFARGGARADATHLGVLLIGGASFLAHVAGDDGGEVLDHGLFVAGLQELGEV